MAEGGGGSASRLQWSRGDRASRLLWLSGGGWSSASSLQWPRGDCASRLLWLRGGGGFR